MLGFGTLKNAVVTLANALTALAATVTEANTGIRQRLQLDGPADAADLETVIPLPVPVPVVRPALPAVAASMNGHGNNGHAHGGSATAGVSTGSRKRGRSAE